MPPLALTATGTIGLMGLGWAGVAPLATAAFGFCPLYSVLGLNTCPARKT